MGGCATKPKVLKGDDGEVPAPAPLPNPTKELVPAVPEAKEAAAAEGERKVEADVVHEVVEDNDNVNEAKEVVIDDNIDDQANKRRSLSNLFKEKEKKGTAESDETLPEPMKRESLESMLQEPLETVKQDSLVPVKQQSMEPVKQELLEPEVPFDPEKLKEAYVTMNQETEEPAKPIEQTYNPEPEPVDPGKIESAQPIEPKLAPEATAVNVPEMQNKETSAGDEKDKTELAK